MWVVKGNHAAEGIVVLMDLETIFLDVGTQYSDLPNDRQEF